MTMTAYSQVCPRNSISVICALDSCPGPFFIIPHIIFPRHTSRHCRLQCSLIVLHVLYFCANPPVPLFVSPSLGLSLLHTSLVFISLHIHTNPRCCPSWYQPYFYDLSFFPLPLHRHCHHRRHNGLYFYTTHQKHKNIFPRFSFALHLCLDTYPFPGHWFGQFSLISAILPPPYLPYIPPFIIPYITPLPDWPLLTYPFLSISGMYNTWYIEFWYPFLFWDAILHGSVSLDYRNIGMA